MREGNRHGNDAFWLSCACRARRFPTPGGTNSGTHFGDFFRHNFVGGTGDSNLYRYVLNHPWKGATACEAGTKYRASLPQRFRDEARNLVNVTGWPLADVLAEMEATGQPTRTR